MRIRIRDPGCRQFGSGMETVRILDPGWKKVGSGIRDKHPGSATLERVSEQGIYSMTIPLKLTGDGGKFCSFKHWGQKTKLPCQFTLRFTCPFSAPEEEHRDLGWMVFCSVVDPDLDPPDLYVFGHPGSGPINMRDGSGSGSTCKNSKKNLDSYCFVTSFELFVFEK
jgi:hypothetical protein